MKKIFVIIVTYNGMKWIDKCLTCLSASNVPLYPVVIDNCSTDNTVAFIQENHKNVHLIETGENLGFGRANNVGMKYALEQHADGVFLLNQDAYIYPDTIEKLLPFMDDYGIVSPVHLDGSGSLLDRGYLNTLKMSAEQTYRGFIEHMLFKKDTSEIFNVPFINAAAWLLSKETLNKVGGFDPIFFHYGEDENYCHRVLFHKMKIGFVSNSFVCHDRDQKNLTTIFKKNADLRSVLVDSMNILIEPVFLTSVFLGKQLVLILCLFFTFQWTKALCRYKILAYIMKMRSQILLHRNVDKQVKLNWI